MRKILLCLLLILLMMPLSAHDIWDAFNDKITIAEYIDEYKELKQVQQFEKFKQDCKKVAMEYTYGIYDFVYYEPKLINVQDGYASYLIPFRLEFKKGVTKVNDILETIKSSLPALSNSHLTPYDCKNLLPEGQYAEVIDNKMAIAVLDDLSGSCKISSVKKENIYIQIAVNHNDKTYISEGFINSVENEVKIVVPVDCEIENLTAQFQSVYGLLSFWDAAITQKTPSEGSKRYQSSLRVYTNEEYNNK